MKSVMLCHRVPEVPRHQRVTQLVQDHADEEHDSPHSAIIQYSHRGQPLNSAGIAGGQVHVTSAKMRHHDESSGSGIARDPTE